jgi:hypothetical protein
VSLWWNKLFAAPYVLRVESTAVSLWHEGTLLQKQAMPNPRDVDDFYAQLSVTMSGVLARANVSKAKRATVYLGQGLVQHSVVTLDVRLLSSNDVASAVQAYWADANSAANVDTKIAWQVQSDGLSVFSSCCDAQLIHHIQSNLETAGWRASGISTHAAQVWNTHRNQIPPNQQCILILQDDVLSMGLQQKGTWRAWSSEICFDTEWTNLSQRAARFLRSTGLCDADTTSKCVYAPHIQSSPLSCGLNNWTVFADSVVRTSALAS